ncbi:MAG: TetR/AcrR family transcriptional regulator [Oscillospiraceae bacterium]
MEKLFLRKLLCSACNNKYFIVIPAKPLNANIELARSAYNISLWHFKASMAKAMRYKKIYIDRSKQTWYILNTVLNIPQRCCMAKQIEGVYERVIECARVEFLDKGYKDASLRTIAQNANSSTGSIYTRFGDKSGLFNALVAPAVEGLKKWFSYEQEAFDKRDIADKRTDNFDYSRDRLAAFFDYVYDHYDEFKLIISCSEGTVFSTFIHDIVKVDVEYTLKFIRDTNPALLEFGIVTEGLTHMLSSAFFTGVFETVVHNMDKNYAQKQVRKMQHFFQIGWKDLMAGGNNTERT